MKATSCYSGGTETLTRPRFTQLFNEIFQAEKALKNILNDHVESVLITNINMDKPSIYYCYCLVLEKKSIEYIEKFSSQKIILRYDLETMVLYKNDQIQDASQWPMFMTKLEAIQKDLASNQAFIYEHKK